jgi:hypothetical protein
LTPAVQTSVSVRMRARFLVDRGRPAEQQIPEAGSGRIGV